MDPQNCVLTGGVTMKATAATLSVILALGLLTVPVPSHAQQPGKVYRTGCLFGGTPPAPANTTPHPLR